jgi:hypothetical protein
MSQYNLVLPENRRGEVIKKEVLLKPSLFGLGKSKIISYLVVVDPSFQGKDKYRVFKMEKNGKWLKEGDNAITLAIKQAVDDHETPIGREAYKELF